MQSMQKLISLKHKLAMNQTPRKWDDVAILINNNPDNTELKSVFGLIDDSVT